MKFLHRIAFIMALTPTVLMAESTEELMVKLKPIEQTAVCAVSIYIKNDGNITNDVRFFLNDFRKQKPLSRLYTDLNLLNKGRDWMYDNGYVNRVPEVISYCKKKFIS